MDLVTDKEKNKENNIQVGSYVVVTKAESELYRRRCEVVGVGETAGMYKVYSEGLEEAEVLGAEDLVPSAW